MEKVIHRLKKFADHKGLTMRKFDFSIKASDGYMQRTLKNDGSVGSDILEKILGIYPEINPYWLLTGEGEMLRESEEVPAAGSTDHSGKEKSEEKQLDYIEMALLQYLDRPEVQAKIRKISKDGRQ